MVGCAVSVLDTAAPGCNAYISPMPRASASKGAENSNEADLWFQPMPEFG